jgi:hypothetical protein
VDPNIACGNCRACRRGDVCLCPHRVALGVDLDGGLAEYAVVPAAQAYPLPPGVPAEWGALCEPLACCLRGLDQAGIRPGMSVAILGGGVNGQLMVQLARLAGAVTVILATRQAGRRALAERLRGAMGNATALLLSDYKGGVVDEATVGLARSLARERGMLSTVDSQGDLARFRGFDLVKCNQLEAEAAAGRPLDREAELDAAGARLLDDLEARYFVVTRGPAGLAAFERGRPPIYLPAANRTEVFDVTGAGDTVIAVLTLALASGASLADAAELANCAAGLVVRRLGVATTSPAELAAAVDG